MNQVGGSALDALHATSAEIFAGALKACDIATAFDRRLRFEGNTLHRLMPDGSGPASIDLSAYKRIFVIALGKAAGPMLETLLDAHEAPQRPARHLLRQSITPYAQLAFPLLRKRPSLAQRRFLRRRPRRPGPAAEGPQRHPHLLPHLRRRLGHVRSAPRPADHPRRNHRFPPAAARLGRAHQRDQYPAQALLRGQGRPPGHGRAGGRKVSLLLPDVPAAHARRALLRSHFARSLHRRRGPRSCSPSTILRRNFPPPSAPSSSARICPSRPATRAGGLRSCPDCPGPTCAG